MSNTVRPASVQVSKCWHCSLKLYRHEDVFTYGGHHYCAPCHERMVGQERKRKAEAEKMAYEQMAARDSAAVQRDQTIRQFLGDMPYAVIATELSKHALVIDDPYAKAAYTHATGNTVLDTDVYAVCDCMQDGGRWFSYVRSDGTINGWHEAVSKAKAEYDSHLAQRLVPALQEHSRLEMIAARERARYEANQNAYIYESEHDRMRATLRAGDTLTFTANNFRITEV